MLGYCPTHPLLHLRPGNQGRMADEQCPHAHRCPPQRFQRRSGSKPWRRLRRMLSCQRRYFLYYFCLKNISYHKLDSIAVPLPESIALLRQSYIPLSGDHYEIPTGTCTPEGDQSTPAQYHVAALGGTFDHLHAGHKILLSMAAWIACEKVIVGITGKMPPLPSMRDRINSTI